MAPQALSLAPANSEGVRVARTPKPHTSHAIAKQGSRHRLGRQGQRAGEGRSCSQLPPPWPRPGARQAHCAPQADPFSEGPTLSLSVPSPSRMPSVSCPLPWAIPTILGQSCPFSAVCTTILDLPNILGLGKNLKVMAFLQKNAQKWHLHPKYPKGQGRPRPCVSTSAQSSRPE